MGKALIIAEKPSVAVDVSRALGGFTRKDDYFESEQYVLSSAVGHVLEICPPEGCEVKRGKWTFAHLPVIPPHFDLKPIEKTEARLRLLVKLMKRKDVDVLINACDAGREGELIFRHLVAYAQAGKTIRRLWLQSMTPAAIRDGFQSLRDNTSMLPLADAAVCRSEADWLVGINGTRAMTAFNSKLGGFQLTTVGRVQTPTLAIIVEREERIKKFIPRSYWEVHGTFAAAAGTYGGRWIDEKYAREKNGDLELKPERLWDQAQADAIRAKCEGHPGVVTEESKPTTQLSPLLFDLTSLQREANGRFGFSAKRTLQVAQSLYEKHKVLTYPRTDSRALPEDYIGTVRKCLEMLSATSYGEFAQTILAQNWLRPNKRIFNNEKISDHFAIIPTAQAPHNLNEDESRLYDMVTKRFLAVFYPAAEFLTTTRITRVKDEPFKSEGKVLVHSGWMTVYGREVQSEDSNALPPVAPLEQVQTTEVKVVGSQTKPPSRFTEATLLTAMEGAGKFIEDEELREAMSAKGLGTPATRASIIEGLIIEKYLVRNARELQPTAKAFSLLALLRGIGVNELCSPELTGNWEFKLKRMELGQLARPEFMREIEEVTRQIVAKARNYEHDTVPGDFGSLKTPCPKCSGVVQENYKKFQCQACDFSLWKILAGRQFESGEMEELLSSKVVGPLLGFRSKLGRPFSALIRLTPEWKIEFDFGQNGGSVNGTAEPVDFSDQVPLGNCPKCGSKVFENGMNYTCEKTAAKPQGCSFRSGKMILQQPVDRDQMVKLLASGRTDVLRQFVSKKGRRFSASLVIGPEGKVGFEFANGFGAGKQKKPKHPPSSPKTS